MFQSPLEILASYAIAFGAGAISICLVVAYGRWMKSGGGARVGLA